MAIVSQEDKDLYSLTKLIEFIEKVEAGGFGDAPSPKVKAKLDILDSRWKIKRERESHELDKN